MKAKEKEKKKKARERRSKEKILKKRFISRAKLKEERESARGEFANRERIEPFVNPIKIIDRDIKIAQNDIVEAKDMKSSEKVIKALKHNLDILENMKQEYLDEQESKKTLNEELEKAGCKTLEDKVDFLNQQALKLSKDDKQAGNVGGSAEVKFIPNQVKRKRKPLHLRKETASCDVVKAEDREDLKK